LSVGDAGLLPSSPAGASSVEPESSARGGPSSSSESESDRVATAAGLGDAMNVDSSKMTSRLTVMLPVSRRTF
jgi:hypothetical protein